MRRAETGSITSVGKNKWLVQVSTSQGRKSKRVTGTKEEAELAAKELTATYDKDKRFIDIAEAWLARRQVLGLANSTIADNKSVIRHLETLHDSCIDAIKPMDIERALFMLGVTPQRLKKYLATLNGIFRYAKSNGLIERNPCEGVELPKQRSESTRRAMDAGEAQEFNKAIDEALAASFTGYLEKEQRTTQADRRKLDGLSGLSKLVAVKIALMTGMRRGEVLGLTRGDVLQSEQALSVTKSNSNYGGLKSTKTERSKRVVYIDRQTLLFLLDWLDFQERELAKIGITASDGTPLICSAKGGLITPSNFSRWYAAQNFDIGMHELRHTQASQLLANGTDSRTIADRMGWSTLNMLDRYTHAVNDKPRQAAATIAELMQY